jgi:DNA-binding response OmpR family regulator
MAKILILDDEKDLAFTLEALLEMEGHQVFTAEKGSEAQEMVKKNQIDAAIVDLHLPDMDGITAMKAIKVISPEIEVGIMSGDSSPDLEKTSYENGASWYFVKPADPKMIIETLEKLCLKKGDKK